MANFELSSAYEVQLDKESHEYFEENSYETGTKMLQLSHRLLEHDLRRLANELGHCFLNGSVARFSLRNQKESDEVKRMSTPFLNFSACSH